MNGEKNREKKGAMNREMAGEMNEDLKYFKLRLQKSRQLMIRNTELMEAWKLTSTKRKQGTMYRLFFSPPLTNTTILLSIPLVWQGSTHTAHTRNQHNGAY